MQRPTGRTGPCPMNLPAICSNSDAGGFYEAKFGRQIRGGGPPACREEYPRGVLGLSPAQQKMVASTDSPDVPDFWCADFSLRHRGCAVRVHTVLIGAQGCSSLNASPGERDGGLRQNGSCILRCFL